MNKVAEPRARRVLICAPVPPEYDRESGSRRIYHLIEHFVDAGWSVAFVCENAPEGSRHIRHLRQRGIVAQVGFDGRTADLVSAGSFDLAIFAFWYLAERHADLVRDLSPQTRVLVESVDLHWLRNARRILGGADGTPGLLDQTYATEFVGELNTYSRADAVLTVSEKEAALLNDIVGDPQLAHAVPDCDEMPPAAGSFDVRTGMLFVGNFRHPPNLDAVAYLCQQILPRLPDGVRERHPLTIVGNGLDGKVREVTHGVDHVRLVGWVPELAPYLHDARISLIPLRYGAGTKRKLIQALLARTPSVSTPIGVEGLPVEDGKHVLVARDAPTFARAVERLLDDEALWTRMASSGRRKMLRAHGRTATRKRLVEVVDGVLARSTRTPLPADLAGDTDRYADWLGEVHEAVARVAPDDEPVLVVSKGDPALVDMPGRVARHFPEASDGRYAGYHPRDSDDALEHLTVLEGRPDYLVVPAPSFWWLDHYTGFARHLEEHHERAWSDEHCVIYRLRPDGGGAESARDDERRLVEPGPATSPPPYEQARTR
jgi:glycosyltransferase involved in cell wall biosynthesis